MLIVASAVQRELEKAAHESDLGLGVAPGAVPICFKRRARRACFNELHSNILSISGRKSNITQMFVNALHSALVCVSIRL